MGVHASGDGAAWDSLEALDVDQPHGLDYREQQHVAKAVRKRLDQEHSTFADATVGGIHTPGGSAVLGVDYTDDCTVTVVADGTYRARGLIWAYSDTSNWGVLFCNTSAAGTSTCGDFTVLKMHPDLQWGGRDVTWQGGHQFDATLSVVGDVSFDANMAIGGDLTVDGAFALGGNAKIVGDCSVDSTFTVGGDAAFHADISIDGTTVVGDTVITGEATLTFDGVVGDSTSIVSVNMFGDWSERTSDGTLGHDVTWTAVTDGMVTTYALKTATALKLVGKTPVATARVSIEGGSGKRTGLSFPVKAGDTWCVSSDNTAWTSGKVYWLPFGDNTQ